MSAPLVKFKRTFNRIEQVECVRESESSVWIAKIGRELRPGALPKTLEIRRAKNTDYESYHDTWVDAHALIVRRAESDVASARSALEYANGKLGNIKGMKPPKEPA